MNRKFNLLIAAAVTVMTVSACSPSGTATTTAQGTTPAGTSAITTTPATQPVTTPAATAASTTTASTTTAVTTMPPATTTAGGPVTHNSDVAKTYINSAEVMAKLDSYRVTTKSQMDLMGMKIDTTSVMDLFNQEKKSKISTTFGDQTTDMYLMNEKLYMNGADGSWMYFSQPSGENPDMVDVDQIKGITDEQFMDMFNYDKVGDGYVIKTKRPLTMADLEKLGNMLNPSSQTDPLETPIDMGDMTYEMEIHFDKEYYMTKSDMTMNTVVDGKTNVTKVNMTYSDFNSVPDFTLPKEALNATEFTIPGLPSTKP